MDFYNGFNHIQTFKINKILQNKQAIKTIK